MRLACATAPGYLEHQHRDLVTPRIGGRPHVCLGLSEKSDGLGGLLDARDVRHRDAIRAQIERFLDAGFRDGCSLGVDRRNPYDERLPPNRRRRAQPVGDGFDRIGVVRPFEIQEHEVV